MAVERVKPKLLFSDEKGPTVRVSHPCESGHINQLGRVVRTNPEKPHYMEKKRNHSGVEYGLWVVCPQPVTCDWCGEKIDWTGVFDGSSKN